MKVKYDKETDILCIKLSDLIIAESDEDKKGVILDYTADGQLVSTRFFLVFLIYYKTCSFLYITHFLRHLLIFCKLSV